MRKIRLLIGTFIPLLCLCSVLVYFVPPVHDRLAWRVDELVLRVKYSLHPPGREVFVPQQGGTPTVESAVSLEFTPTATPSPTEEPSPTAASTRVAPTPFPTVVPTTTPTPLPEQVDLKGVVYEDQHGRLNYCAPANLAMALSFWGWKGDRDVVGPALKPDARDKNVMPYEMVSYVLDQTNLKVVSRVGGDLDLLKRFLAAGYPVLVEKGVRFRDLTGVVSWMGHYLVVTGFDEAGGYFIAQDSFIKPDNHIPYDIMLSGWRAFNYIYLVIYPPEREAEVMALLGPDADEEANYQHAAAKASTDILTLTGIDQYFAWFNRGASLVELQDYAGAALAYDEGFKIYPTIPESERPWRMLWYSTGPYWAYFYSQRYYDVLYLADGTLNAMQSDKNLEESYYWRGMAKAALGDPDGAIQDFETALEFHPGFEPALYQLRLLGVDPSG
jgi:hypothetical protein